MRPITKIDLAIAALLSATLIFLLASKVDSMSMDSPQFAEGGDHLAYWAMATKPQESVGAPFCYRILVPGLVSILPIAIESGFYMLTLAFLWGTGIFMYLVLRELGEDNFFAWSGVALFHGLNWASKFTLWDFWLTDPALFFFGIVAFLAVIRRNIPILVLALMLGVMAKEAMVFVLPLYYGYHAHKWLDLREAGITVLIGLLPIALLLGLRISVPHSNNYVPFELFQEHGLPRLTRDLVGNLWGGTLGTWGVLVFAMAVWGLCIAGQRLRRAAVFFLPCVYTQPLFANNLDRLLVFGFIVVIPLAVAGLRSFAMRFRLTDWMTAGYVVLPLLFLLLKNGYMPASREQQLIAFLAWSGLIFLVRRTKRRSTEPDVAP